MWSKISAQPSSLYWLVMTIIIINEIKIVLVKFTRETPRILRGTFTSLCNDPAEGSVIVMRGKSSS